MNWSALSLTAKSIDLVEIHTGGQTVYVVIADRYVIPTLSSKHRGTEHEIEGKDIVRIPNTGFDVVNSRGMVYLSPIFAAV